MCGTVGLFVGCPKAAICPTREDPVGKVPAGLEEYVSAYDRWDTQASVRRAPRRLLRHELDGRVFPTELTPLLNDETLRRSLDADAEMYLQTQQLYRYLDFTTKLELYAINGVALSIAMGHCGVPVPSRMRQDALKIYVDEGYHALFSIDMMLQTEQSTGIAPRLPEVPGFLRSLETIRQKNPGYEALIDLLFVTVSETLITKSLTDVANGGAVDAGVAAMMKDHARDEGRHHSYFRRFARYLWAASSRAERRLISTLVPEMVVTFCRPEVAEALRDLAEIGVVGDLANEVVSRVYSASAIADAAAAAGAQTLEYFLTLGSEDVHSSMPAHLSELIHAASNEAVGGGRAVHS